VIFREEDFSEEEFRSVALLVERRAGDNCGRDEDGKFAPKNDCQEGDGGTAQKAPKQKKSKEDAPTVSRPPAGERVSSLTTRSLFDGSEKLELPKERGAVKEETIARALTQRAITAHGGTPIDVDKPMDETDVDVLSDALADDIQGAYERSGRHAGWYSQDVGDAMDIASRLPGNEQIANDPIHKFVFGFGMGILSAQNGVEDNATFADGFYRNWRETGSLVVPDEYRHVLGRGIDTSHFRTMQELVDRNGWDEVIRYFSSSDTVNGIAADGKVMLPGFGGFKVAKERVDTVVPRFAIFGPKIGPFTHAIVNGDYDHLVMDRWTMRQAGALTGTLLKETDPDKVRGHAERLLSASSGNRSGNSLWYGLPKAEVVSSLKRTLKSGRFDEQDVGWEFVRRVQSAYANSVNSETGGGFGDKTELNLAANNAFKSKVEMQLAPGNGTVANNVRQVFAEATRKTGANNVLEVQALGWVDTQNLWQTLGYRLKKDPNENTFSSAFAALRDGRRERITSLKEEAEKKRRGREERAAVPPPPSSADTTPIDVFGGEYQSLFDEAVASREYQEYLVSEITAQIRRSQNKESRSADCGRDESGKFGDNNKCQKDGTGVADDPIRSGGDGNKDWTRDELASSPPFSGADRLSSLTVAAGNQVANRLEGLGVGMDEAAKIVGSAKEGDSVYVRPAVEFAADGEDGVLVRTRRDVAGVKDGMESNSVLMSVGPPGKPDLVLKHHLMSVADAVKSDPAKRHAAAREFFRVMADSVSEARKSGVTKVVFNAAGRASQPDGFRGYTIWPRMGFDAPIPYNLKQKLPESLSHAKTLLDLHSTREGTNWWRDNGTDVDVVLDLADRSSPQNKAFDAFVRKLLRESRELPLGSGDEWLSPEDLLKLDELWDEIDDQGLFDDYDGESQDFSILESGKKESRSSECGQDNKGRFSKGNDCASEGGAPPASAFGPPTDFTESDHEYKKDELQKRPPFKGAEKLESLGMPDEKQMRENLTREGLSLDDAVTLLSPARDGGHMVITVENPDEQLFVPPPPGTPRPFVTSIAAKEIDGGWISSVTSMARDSEGLILNYEGFLADDSVQASSTVTAAREMMSSVLKSLDAAESMGVAKVVLNAAGDAKSTAFKGYRIWPKFGFDGVIPKTEKFMPLYIRLRNQDLSPRAQEEKKQGRLTIQALYETKFGQQMWERHGGELAMSLRPGSDTPGWQRFKKMQSRIGRLAEDRSLTLTDDVFSEETLAYLDEVWAAIRGEVEQRAADCGRDESGRFGSGNKCASASGETQDGKWEIEPNKDGTTFRIDAEPATHVVRLKGDDGKVKAFVLGTVVDDSSPPKFYVDYSHVVEKERGKGVYTGLLKSLSDQFTVVSDSPPNLALEAEKAYKRLGAEKDPYSGGYILHKKPTGDSRAFCATGEGGGVDNSCGAEPAATQQPPDTPAFKSWFGESKVVDGDGKPLVVYHGTAKPFTTFDKKFSAQGLFWFSSDKDKILRGESGAVSGKSLIPVFLSAKKLAGWDEYDKYTLGQLRDQGYDGIKLDDDYVVFEPSQIKSAVKNSGGYNPKSKSIHRAFCPTGDGGGIDNSCGANPKMAADKDSVGSGSTKWGGKTEPWGRSGETEIWTPDKPLFPGAENLPSIKIERPSDIRSRLEDSLKVTISDAVLASGAVIATPDSAKITQPRLIITPDMASDGVTVAWTCTGVATGKGFSKEEAEFADPKGSVVRAAEASRSLRRTASGTVLHMDGFFIHPDFRGKGIALEAVSRSVSSPVVRLEMSAERYDASHPNRHMTGYRVWPRYGYDARISDVAAAIRGEIPAEFAKAKTLLDIYATPGGPEWWAENGKSIGLTFDMRPRSRSREILLQLQDKSRSKRRSLPVSKPTDRLGSDSDYDDSIDEVWAEIQQKGLSGQSPSQEDWDQWAKEAKDGDSGKVQPH